MMKKSHARILKLWEKEFKKGFISILILISLIEKDMYGYELPNHLNNLSGGEITYQESGIYQVLKKLKQKKIVSSFVKSSPMGPRRKYYRITSIGRDLAIQFSKKCVMPLHSQLEQLINKALNSRD